MASKQPRVELTWAEKEQVLNLLESGEKQTKVAKRFSVNKSTISRVWKNKESILVQVHQTHSSVAIAMCNESSKHIHAHIHVKHIPVRICTSYACQKMVKSVNCNFRFIATFFLKQRGCNKAGTTVLFIQKTKGPPATQRGRCERRKQHLEIT